MITKPTVLSPPWNDSKLVNLERMLILLFSGALQHRVASYTGDGVDDREIDVGTDIKVAMILRKPDKNTASFPVSGNAVFAFQENDGVSYVPGTGFVNNAVKSVLNRKLKLGINTDVNEAGTNYFYFIIG